MLQVGLTGRGTCRRGLRSLWRETAHAWRGPQTEVTATPPRMSQGRRQPLNQEATEDLQSRACLVVCHERWGDGRNEGRLAVATQGILQWVTNQVFTPH